MYNIILEITKLLYLYWLIKRDNFTKYNEVDKYKKLKVEEIEYY